MEEQKESKWDRLAKEVKAKEVESQEDEKSQPGSFSKVFTITLYAYLSVSLFSLVLYIIYQIFR